MTDPKWVLSNFDTIADLKARLEKAERERDELGEQLRVTRQCEKDRRNERDAAREALRVFRALAEDNPGREGG